MTSAKNSVSEPPNLKIFWGGYPQTPYVARAFGTWESAPPPLNNKKPSYGPGASVQVLLIKSQNCAGAQSKNLGYGQWLLAKWHHSRSLKASSLGASTTGSGWGGGYSIYEWFLARMTFDCNLYERMGLHSLGSLRVLMVSFVYLF